MTPLQEKIMRAIADLHGKRLDATYEAVARKVGADAYHVTTGVVPRLMDKGLVECCRWDQGNHRCFRPTAAGWAAIGVAPLMGMEPV